MACTGARLPFQVHTDVLCPASLEDFLDRELNAWQVVGGLWSSYSRLSPKVSK